MKQRPIHVLHIGKTGGSALNLTLEPYARELGISLHGHDWTLADVPPGEGVIFIVRDVVQRFVSGFNSRLRKGLPRTLVEWTDAEAAAFARFATPSALAEGLASEHPPVRAAAVEAIGSIYHPARKLAFWLRSAAYVRDRRDDILWVGVTSHLDEDFARLVGRLGLPTSLRLPTEPFARHATPNNFERTLTRLGEQAIADWYAEDRDILAACLELRASLNAADTGCVGADTATTALAGR